MNMNIKTKEFFKGERIEWLLFVVVVFGFVIPALIYGRPVGTDTYTHIEETGDVYMSSSLHDFYHISSTNILHPQYEYNVYNYPFGLWLFGSLVAKITGLSPYFIAYLLPIIYVSIIIAVFYLYLHLFHDKKQERLLGVLFLLSIPTFTINLLSYRPSVFTIPFVLIGLYFTLKEGCSFVYKIFFVSLCAFLLCISHTGTFIFLLFFSILYMLLYSILKGKLHNAIYLHIVLLFVSYYVSMSLFPEISPQYVDKSRFILTTGDFISSSLGLGLVKELTDLIYQQIFVEVSLFYLLFLLSFIYSFANLFAFLNAYLVDVRDTLSGKDFLASIPLVGGASNISHSIYATPIWVGPFHSFFSLIGFLRMNLEKKILFIAVLMVTVIPGYLSIGATGALREIFYLYLVVPTTSVIGFLYIVERLKKRNLHNFILPFMLVVFVSFVVVPLVGNLYYMPQISHEDYQVNGMAWLGNFGQSQDTIEGYGYRDIRVLTHKKTVSDQLMSGKETTTFLNNLKWIYFSTNSENFVENLATSYNLKYYLVSEKIVDSLGRDFKELKIESNTELDNIYASKDFLIYQNPTEKASRSNLTDDLIKTPNILFAEDFPEIKDVGNDFLVETKNYKIKLNKFAPKITYLGDSTTNLLGEGYLTDYMRILWSGSGPYSGKYDAYSSDKFPPTNVSLKDNILLYKSVLESASDKEKLSTVYVVYTFYNVAIKKEIILSNDWVSSPGTERMGVRYANLLFLPSRNLTYVDFYGKQVEKVVYPSSDNIEIDEKFKSIYFSESDSGIYMQFEDTSPMPASLGYRGMVVGDHMSCQIGLDKLVSPSASLHVTQYLSVGDFEIAKKNVGEYAKAKIYPYPDGKVPLIFVSYLDQTNPLTNSGRGVLESSMRGYDFIKTIGLNPFTEGVDAKEEDINENLVDHLNYANISVIGSTGLFTRSFDSRQDQDLKISNLTENSLYYYDIDLNGFIPKSLRYNLDTVGVLTEKNFSFMFSDMIRSPVYEYYHEGLRYPEFAIYVGEETNMVLLPVSRPASYSMGGASDIEGITSAWKSAIDSVVMNDDLCVFLWRSEELGNELYWEAFNDSLDYGLSKGMKVIGSAEAAQHFILMKKVYFTVSQETDQIQIWVKNDNIERVNGATIKLTLPKLNGTCDYATFGGDVKRQEKSFTACDFYISSNLAGGEIKKIEVYSETKNEIFLDLENPQLQGIVKFRIKDASGEPIASAVVQIDNATYSTDSDGFVDAYLRKGHYTITVGKLGFTKKTVGLDVVGRLTFFTTFTRAGFLFFLIVGVLISVLFLSSRYMFRKKFKIRKKNKH